MNLKNLSIGGIKARMCKIVKTIKGESKYKRKKKSHFGRELLSEGLCIVIAGISVLLVFNNIGLGKDIKELKKDQTKLEQRLEEADNKAIFLEEEVEQKNIEIKDYESKLNEKTEENGVLKNKINELEKEIVGLNEKLKKNTNTGNIVTVSGNKKDYNTQGMGIDTSKKTYMDYRCISRSSKQGSIVYGDESWTDEDGLRRWGSRYCVAMGRK